MKATTIAVIDGGGRGSVLVKKYLKSPGVKKILAIPGNDLMKSKNVQTFPNLKTTDVKEIVEICRKNNVSLVDVAQDDAIAAGLTNELQKAGIKCFGPTKEAAILEWDKATSRNFMKKFNLPIPYYQCFSSEKEGIQFIQKSKDSKWFVKASGLAAGKGALPANNNKEAIERIIEMKNFGKSGKTYLIEECLEGEEFSSFAILDGKNFKIIGNAQDHKTVFNAGVGPNTGGMGCSSPPLAITPKVQKQIEEIFKKTVEGLISLNIKYQGILYLGGMITENELVKIIEFNCRWGDPEAQVIVPSIKEDLYDICTNAASGNLNRTTITTDNLYRLVVTAASRGYPTDNSKALGKQIYGLDNLQNSKEVEIFSAAVKSLNNKYTVAGGRLFYVMAEAKNILEARKKVYNAIAHLYIEGNNLHFRTDIGNKDLARFYNRLQKSPLS